VHAATAAGPDSDFHFELAFFQLVWSLVTATFSDLGVSPELVTRLRTLGLTTPFPIQEATIPDALAGRDVCGRAPTGSGKTLAFGLTIASRCTGAAPRRPLALVLVPTRELAAQVQREIAGLSAGGSRRVIAIYGGTGYSPTRQALQKGVDAVVACPGRLEDLLSQQMIDLSAVKTVVLDEADRMADMGFLPSVKRILDVTAPSRQVLLFSATLGPEIEALVRQYLHNPARHDVTPAEESSDVSHLFWHAEREERVSLTARLVGEHGRALVFCRTRHGADRLAKQLKFAGVEAMAIHGDRSQAQRERALAAFSRGSAQVLVATDVAARGIHVEDLPCVVHFDPPADATDYLHRSGRTGRAGKTGTVVSLVTGEQQKAVRSLQRSLGLEERVHAPGGAVSRRLAPSERSDGPARSDRPARSARPVRLERQPRSESRRPEPARPGFSQRPDLSQRPDFSQRSGRQRPEFMSRGAGTGRGDRWAAPQRELGRHHAAHAGSDSSFGSVAVQDRYNDRNTDRNTEYNASRRHNQGVRMPVGTVKFFNAEKGYGFVSRPDGEDVFVHYSNVQGSGYRTLEAGQQVEFEVAPGRKGDEARNVKVI
jgi:superfamily II DNA/RNA helicase/cold shock CspA family protein